MKTKKRKTMREQLPSIKNINVVRKKYVGEIFGILGSRVGFVNCFELNKVFAISPEDMDLFFPGDLVNISILDPKSDKIIITDLIETKMKRFTGKFFEDETGSYVIPDVYGLTRKIRVPKSMLRYNEENGDLVSAEIIEHPFVEMRKRALKFSSGKAKSAKASILGIISKSNAPNRESNYCVYKNNLPSRFSSDILYEVANIPNDYVLSRIHRRFDLSDKSFISIDGSMSHDIDDAICVEETSTGFKLYVSISDVSEYINDSSQLNKEVLDRASSVYMLGHYLPMLPSELSKKCSLGKADVFERADERVLTLTVEIDIDFNGQVIDYEIYESFISDNIRLTYDFVEEVVNGYGEQAIKDVELDYRIKVDESHLEHIFRIYKLHNLLMSNRDNALGDVDESSFRVELDNKIKRIVKISKVNDKTSKSIVRELMLLTNSLVAKFIIENVKSDKQSIFVVRDGVKRNRVDEIKSIFANKGVDFDGVDNMDMDFFNKALSQFSKEDKEIILSSVKDTSYSNHHSNNYYRGIAQYTHFTSPLRRYPDIVTHRLIKSILRGEIGSFDLGVNIDRLNSKIKNIKRTEKEVENWLKYYYLADNYSGVILNAKVVSVSESIVSVRLIDNGIDGIFIANKGFKEKHNVKFSREDYSLNSDDFSKIKALENVKVVLKEFDFVSKKIVFDLVV